ncbi:hypothetical protein [Aquibacillus sediminis]|uniref:hypothetical protein n=1 Tax=Aquibacillus sediminis TaxID=2574734 RepID=UPI001109EB5D|nr:hypothetical protein [Aquibacillus sediminis]
MTYLNYRVANAQQEFTISSRADRFVFMSEQKKFSGIRCMILVAILKHMQSKVRLIVKGGR